MLRFIVIGAGGAIGTLLRYKIGGLDCRFSSGVFPINTLVVNVSGSFLIGFLWGVVDRFAVSSNLRLFIFIGVLGGYTTFSTFSLETFKLMRDGEYRTAMMNVALSVILSVGAVFLGYLGSKIVAYPNTKLRLK
ncbi:MAG: fluoride efflux transporter CrcB [Candidatus Schekmanbacteria bacterium]|nr:fluoride efflux transporter CrcB [Candidatus Schekmanbacteria bacterium]